MNTNLKILLLISLSLLISCSQKENKIKNVAMQDNFPYGVTVNAPKEYPVEVHEGWLLDSKKEFICAMPKAGKEGDGWIYDGSKAGQGGNVIPYHLNLTYVAYAEKKFYTVDADLPADKILEAFKKGFLIEGNDKKIIDGQEIYNLVPDTYNILTIGAAPGGVIVVWLSGNHNRVEICRLQAKEVFVDRNDFYDNPHARTQQGFFDTMFEIAVPKDAQKKIKEKGIPYGLWDKYREKFNYRFVLKPYDDKDIVTGFYLINYNGESRFIPHDSLAAAQYEESAIPYDSSIYFKIYSTEIIFDDEEMLNVFKKLSKENPNQGIDIIVVPTFEYQDMKVSVKCGITEIPLKHYKVKGIWGG